jgi:hypothetical protein
MKCFLLFLILYVTGYSQSVVGIYLNGGDFRKNEISPSKKCKIKIHESPYRPIVQLKYQDTICSYKKDSIFGYIDSHGSTFRFYKKLIYTIINPKENILIYKREVDSGNPKDFRTNTVYYFSKDEKSDILPLNVTNVLNAFNENERFTDLIETHFRSNADLLTYDGVHLKFKINHLLELSKKQINEN